MFRLGGAKQLAERIGDPVTHGGIYLGGGLIHDMVGFGNRDVRVSDFYRGGRRSLDREDHPIRRPRADVHRAAGGGQHPPAQPSDLPTDPLPWNLFSSALDYRTATCLELAPPPVPARHSRDQHRVRLVPPTSSTTCNAPTSLRARPDRNR